MVCNGAPSRVRSCALEFRRSAPCALWPCGIIGADEYNRTVSQTAVSRYVSSVSSFSVGATIGHPASVSCASFARNSSQIFTSKPVYRPFMTMKNARLCDVVTMSAHMTRS